MHVLTLTELMNELKSKLGENWADVDAYVVGEYTEDGETLEVECVYLRGLGVYSNGANDLIPLAKETFHCNSLYDIKSMANISIGRVIPGPDHLPMEVYSEYDQWMGITGVSVKTDKDAEGHDVKVVVLSLQHHVVDCPNCGQYIEETAKVCPVCGVHF
jgi:hypothetical protein